MMRECPICSEETTVEEVEALDMEAELCKNCDVILGPEKKYIGSEPGEWKELNPSARDLFDTDA